MPTSRTVNGKALSADITLTAADVGARANSWTPTAAETGAAPTNHASTATNYGLGTGVNYGHVKLSDSTTSTSGTSGGVAATPAAVKAVKDLISSTGSYVSGSYTGDNSETRTISLPFTPSAVLLRRDQLSSGTSTTVWNFSHLAVTGAPSYDVGGNNEMLSVTTNGFKVYRPSSANNAGCTNASNATWHYIAFK